MRCSFDKFEGEFYRISFEDDLVINSGDVAFLKSEIQKKVDTDEFYIVADVMGINGGTASGRFECAEFVDDRLKAIALLVDSKLLKTLCTLYIKINKPKTPTRIFDSEDEALAWLKDFPNCQETKEPAASKQDKFLYKNVPASLVGGSFIVVFLLFTLLGPYFGAVILSLSVIPPVFTAYFFGFRAGLAAVMIVSINNYFQMQLLQGTNGQEVIIQTCFGAAANLLITFFASKVGKIKRKVTQQKADFQRDIEQATNIVSQLASKKYDVDIDVKDFDSDYAVLAGGLIFLQQELQVSEERAERLNQQERKTSAEEAARVVAEEHAKKLSRLNEKLRSTQANLVQATKLSSLGTLAASVAHELNNPLTAVKGFAQILDIKGSSDYEKSVAKKIIHSSTRMQEIVNHLRVFSRKSKDEDWTLIDINRVVNSAYMMFETQLTNRGIEFNFETSIEAKVRGNSNELESVFQNFLTNSRDAFDSVEDNRDKKITVTLRADTPDAISIVFRDNAVGMSEDSLKQIYDPFFTTKPEGIGTGLGMSICNEIVNNHDGDLCVESKLGAGTDYRVTFPLPNDSQIEKLLSTDKKTKTSESTLTTEIKPKLLVIDDEEDICDLLSACLNEYFDVTQESNPAEALAIMKKKKFDIILTDLRMPKISGIQIVEKKSSCPENKDTPIVIISGHAQIGDDMREAFIKGAKGLITKPFDDARILSETIKSYMD